MKLSKLISSKKNVFTLKEKDERKTRKMISIKKSSKTNKNSESVFEHEKNFLNYSLKFTFYLT